MFEGSAYSKILLLKLDDGCARTALILRGLIEARDVRVVAQEIRDCFAKRARAVTVNDADLVETIQVGLVQKLVRFINGFVRSVAYDVKFGVEFFGCSA